MEPKMKTCIHKPILVLLSAFLLIPTALMQALPDDDPIDTVLVTGTIVDKKGAPLAGKTICFMIANEQGYLVARAHFNAEGQLDFPKARTNAKGYFSKRVERFDPLTVALCRVTEDLQVLDTKPLKTISTADNTKKRFDLGKLQVE